LRSPDPGSSEESKNGSKNCAGLHLASGTLGAKFRRKYTENLSEEARAIATAWELSSSLDGEHELQEPPPPLPDAAAGHVNIEQAIRAFTSEFRPQKPGPKRSGSRNGSSIFLKFAPEPVAVLSVIGASGSPDYRNCSLTPAPISVARAFGLRP